MKLHTYKPIDVSTASFPVSLPLTGSTSRYKIYGTKTLSGNVAISPSGTPKEGMSVDIDFTAVITPGVNSFTVFDQAIPTSILGRKLKIHCEYHSGAWGVFILLSMGTQNAITPELLDPLVVDDTTLSITAVTGRLKVKDGGIAATQLATDAVTTGKILAKAVTLAKMDDLAAGKIILGSAGNTPAAVTPTGDVTITNAGVMAIGAQKVLAGMVKGGELDAGHLAADAGIAFSQMEALTPSMIPVLNGSGVIVSSGVLATKLSLIDSQTKITTFSVLNGTQTLTSVTIKVNHIIDSSAGATDITLPAASTCVVDQIVEFMRSGANAAGLLRSGADVFVNIAGSDVTSLALAANGSGCVLRCNGSNQWKVIRWIA